MNPTYTNAVLDQFFEPIGRCLPPDDIRQLLDFQLDPDIQKRVAELASKANEGDLSEAERVEYEAYIDANEVIAILQAKVRSLSSRR